MSEEPTTTGTTADGNAGATGTTAGGNAEELAALKAENERLKQVQQQALAEKTNYEATRRRLEALESAGGQPPTTVADTRAQRLQAVHAQLQVLAGQGDPGAEWQLATLEEIKSQAARNQYLEELLTIPDSRRDKVAEMARQHRVTPKVAALMLKGQEASELEAKVAELEGRVKQEKAQQTVHTATVGVTASEVNKGIMKASDYQSQLKRLQEVGDMAGAKKLVEDRTTGKIQLRFGE